MKYGAGAGGGGRRRPRLAAGRSIRGEGVFEWVLWTSLAAVAALLLWAAFQNPEVRPTSPEELEALNRIVMDKVKIDVYGDDMRLTSTVQGQQSITFKNNQDFVVLPVFSRIYRDNGQHIAIRADKLWKRIVRHDERMEFSGTVKVESPNQRMSSEALTFHPKTEFLESEAPVHMITTGTAISAGKLETNIDIQTGSLKEDVQIVSLGKPGRELDQPLRMKGRLMDFDLVQEIYKLQEDAWVFHDEMEIQGGEIHLFNNAGRVIARKDVRAVVADPPAPKGRPRPAVRSAPPTTGTTPPPYLTLDCQELTYETLTKKSTAIGSPKAIHYQRPTGDEGPSKHHLSAARLVLEQVKGVLSGAGSVQVERYVVFERDWEPDFRINGDEFVHYTELGRTNFKGHVKIKTSVLESESDRAIFYRDAARIYIVGDAHAWDIDMDGKRTNHIHGDKIIHNLKTGKSMVLQGGIQMREEDVPR